MALTGRSVAAMGDSWMRPENMYADTQGNTYVYTHICIYMYVYRYMCVYNVAIAICLFAC